MTKNYKMEGDKLIVTINNSDKIFLPNENGDKSDIGMYEQNTVQIIENDQIDTLKAFVGSEMDKAKKQLDELVKQYEPIKDIIDLDEKIVAGVKKALEKSQKAFKDKCVGLSQHIDAMARKDTLKAQIDYIEKQIIEIQADVDGLNNSTK